MDCQEFHLQVFTYMDGELSVIEQRSVTLHIEVCPSCAQVLAYEVRIREVVAQRCCESAPEEMRDRVLRALGLADPA